MPFADTKGSLESDLCLPNASEADNGSSLTVICFCIGRDLREKFLQY